MAYNDVEVEIKVRLTKKRFEDIRKIVKKTCKFVKRSYHIDDYYSPKYKSFLTPRYPFEWLTVRSRDGKHLLNYKHWYPEGAKNTTHCDEYETEIADPQIVAKILSALRFRRFVSVEKERSVYVYRKRIEIALDKVKGLGYFIEVESLKDMGGIDKTHTMLVDYMHSLGIKNTDTVPGGYASELMRKKRILKN